MKRHPTALPCFLAMGLTPACGDDNGATSTASASPMRITVTAEARGAQCPDGGIAITVGDGVNGNGPLDEDEIDETS